MNQPSDEGSDYHIYLRGGVPPLGYFQIRVLDLIETISEPRGEQPINFTAELCVALSLHYCCNLSL
jgi:hypothetical protein